MKKGVYYKVLTTSGKSLMAGRRRRYRRGKREAGRTIRYPLPKGGKPGEWVKVPKPGAFVMRLNEMLTLPYRYKRKLILVRLECRGLVSRKESLRPGKGVIFMPAGTRCFREVRVMEVVPFNALPPTAGYWRRRFATLPTLSRGMRAKLVLGISSTLPDDRMFAAVQTPGLTRAEKWELVSTLPPDPAYCCYAALQVRGLSGSQRAELVKDLKWTDNPRIRIGRR